MLNEALAILVSSIVLALLGYIVKNINKLFRKIEFIDRKHDALVIALHKWSKNGFMKDYREALGDVVQQDQYINK